MAEVTPVLKKSSGWQTIGARKASTHSQGRLLLSLSCDARTPQSDT